MAVGFEVAFTLNNSLLEKLAGLSEKLGIFFGKNKSPANQIDVDNFGKISLVGFHNGHYDTFFGQNLAVTQNNVAYVTYSQTIDHDIFDFNNWPKFDPIRRHFQTLIEFGQKNLRRLIAHGLGQTGILDHVPIRAPNGN